MSEIKGYKVFNSDWTCRGFQYEVGKVFEEDAEPKCCSRGFHFCEKAGDCFNYYTFNPDNKAAEVVALGEVDAKDDLACTNKIQIVREIPWAELLTIVNTGHWNTGNRNTGDCNTGNSNTGHCNTGNCNTGNRNTGDCNTGNSNTGNSNTGNWNTGYCNTGNCNTGDWNTGYCNTGHWNTTNYSSGCFNTIESSIILFDKPSDMTMNKWLKSDARHVMDTCPCDRTVWIKSTDMTGQEREEHPEHENTGGYLKVIKVSDADKQEWWDGLKDKERECVKALPNFDADIFYKCTGIKVGD